MPTAAHVTDQFGQVAAELSGRHGCRCVVTWGPGEQEIAQEEAAASAGKAIVAPEFGLGPLIELIRLADCVIAADTGPLYISALLQRPTVALFGPKDPAVYAPAGPAIEIIRSAVECSPCSRRRCDHPRCMLQIETSQVIEAAERLLRPVDSTEVL